MITKKHVQDLKQKFANGQNPDMPLCLWHALHDANWNGVPSKNFDPKSYLNKALIEIGLLSEKGFNTRMCDNYERTLYRRSYPSGPW